MSNIDTQYNINDIIEFLQAKQMPQVYINLIIKANDFATCSHNGQTRESGEPYIVHPQEVARILVKEMKCLDPNSIAASDLHDTVEDCEKVCKELLIQLFNEIIANMVDGVTKIHKLNFNSLTEADTTNLKKLLSYSIMGNIAILLLKFADRLHNMRTLHYKKEEYKRLENASETLIYANLAHWLGIEWLSKELKDLAYQYLHPEYLIFKDIVKKYIKSETDNIALMEKQISNLLKIPYNVNFHIKSDADLYDEMHTYKTFDNIHDTKQIRIIGHDKSDCYRILDLINEKFNHQKFSHKQRDYIEEPKLNLYQALHTTVVGPNGSTFQIQIMTEEMNEINENGITHYWDGTGRMQEVFNEKFGFFRNFLEEGIIALAEDDNYVCHIGYNETFKDSVYVYTEKGQRKFLPRGATIIDYAYERYADARVNNKLMGIYINGKPASPFSLLNDHDKIELVFSDDNTQYLNIIKPTYEWLSHCILKKAKAGINKSLESKAKNLTITL